MLAAGTRNHVVLRVLHRVACLVGGDAHRRDGGLRIDRVGQADDIGSRVKMIGQLARYVLDAHTADAVLTEHILRSLRARHAARVGDLRVL